MTLGIIRKKISKNGPMILTITASIGVVLTAVSAAKQTPKAMELLDRCQECNCGTAKTIMVVAPVYLPTFGFATGTILCIFGANYLSIRQQASLISAYKLLETSYKDYRNKVMNVIGEEQEFLIRKELAMDALEDYEIDDSEEDPLFYDEYTKEFFNVPNSVVQDAAYQINRILATIGYASLNDYRRLLNRPLINGGDKVGWSLYSGPTEYGFEWLDFVYDKMELEGGMECWSIYYDPPRADYFG